MGVHGLLVLFLVRLEDLGEVVKRRLVFGSGVRVWVVSKEVGCAVAEAEGRGTRTWLRWHWVRLVLGWSWG